MTKEFNEVINDILDSEEPGDYVICYQEPDRVIYESLACSITLSKEKYETWRYRMVNLTNYYKVYGIYKHIIGGGMELIWPKK